MTQFNQLCLGSEKIYKKEEIEVFSLKWEVRAA